MANRRAFATTSSSGRTATIERVTAFQKAPFPCQKIAASVSSAVRFVLVHGSKTPYDRLVAELRAIVKRDATYQSSAERRIVEFPAGSSWLAITSRTKRPSSTASRAAATSVLDAAGSVLGASPARPSCDECRRAR